MNILGIDLGQEKTGLAIAEGPLAEPLKVIYHASEDSLISHISQIVANYKIEKIVLGISENKMAATQKSFAVKLQEVLKIPVELEDETLSSYDAQALAIEANIKRKKRKRLEDAYAAALILQNYLEK